MTILPLPESKHDLALWLISVLTDQATQGESQVTGVLPSQYDFDAVDQALEKHNIAGISDKSTRRVEFYPSWADVYPTFDSLLAKPDNLAVSPSVFTLLDIGYTHGHDANAPEMVTNYLCACKLFQVLRGVADITDVANRLTFLQRQDAKLTISLNYDRKQLVTLSDLDELAGTFVDSKHHSDQKRTIVRTTLIDMFRGQNTIFLSDLMVRFDDFMDRVRSAYAMYVAEFTFEKIKAEVEKDNLDSTVKLQKTITDIQNQLLALPVAVLLSGGQMTSEQTFTIKNSVVWLGCIVFVGITLILIENQRFTIKAITQEVKLRESKTDSLPNDIKSKFNKPFKSLADHALRQQSILKYLFTLVFGSGLLSTGLWLWYSLPSLRCFAFLNT